jgi:hypothetical protein
MVRMGVVKTDDVFATFPPFALDANQLSRIDVIAVLRRVGPRVAAPGDGSYPANLSIHFAQEYAAAFVRIRLFTMLA